MASKNKKNKWESAIEKFEEEALKHERDLEEAGYWGQGSSVDGSATFRGGPFGFGGENQLAAPLAAPVEKLKKQRDKEAVYNIASQQKINRGYPAPQSVSGYPGGESNSGIRSGERLPTSITDMALTPAEYEAILNRPPKDEYFGLDKEDLSPVPLDDEEPYAPVTEQVGAGFQGPQRGVASDQNYRDLPGWPRPNTIEKPGNFVPEVEGDEDGDGEEDDYLTDEEYVNDVLRLNGIGIKPGHLKKLFGAGGASELEEAENYTSGPNWPDPNRPTERYKQGYWEETPQGDDWLIAPVDYSKGHVGDPPAETSPGGQSYGQIGQPKDFVPQDWEQRHPKTEEEPMEPGELRQFIESAIKEALQEEMIDEASENEPTNPELWSRAKAAAKRKFDVYPSAYANAWASKWYKNKGGGWRKKKKTKKESLENVIRNLVKEEMGVQEKVHKDSGLGKWFGEKWVDISRKKKDGGHPECGASADKGKRKSDSSKAYPKCVKKSKAQSMSKKDKESATRRKRAKPNKPGKPDNTSTDKRKTKKEAYTGIHDKTGKGEPKGGSKAFKKNRKKVLDYDKDQKPGGIEDLKNYHMDD